MLLQQCDDTHRILVGNQTAGYFRMRRVGQNRLDSLLLESTPDAVHLQRRANPAALTVRVSRFAELFFQAQLLPGIRHPRKERGRWRAVPQQ